MILYTKRHTEVSNEVIIWHENDYNKVYWFWQQKSWIWNTIKITI